ncbi:MAG TPA: VWA domain-containing protein [Vicinamibacterales bacterium]|nr:VWA domain-containing protein [Vicinamibacterales bacterium]
MAQPLGRRAPRPRAAVFAVFVSLALGLLLHAQQTFRSSTSIVAVYATVTDARGALVTDLGAADFEISDNGARQNITVFKSDVQPITIAILLDTSPSLFPAAGRTASAVAEFTKRLMPGDRAAIGTFSHAVTLDPQLTSDPVTLLARLGAPGPWPAGTALWDAIEAGRAALANEGGRRVVLVVTDGADNASRVDPNATRSALQREGVMVCAITVRGRFGLETSEIGALANATGGRSTTVQSADDIAAAMQRIADELHQQYVLGFSPKTLDDKLHRLEVQVKRRDLVVRARRMYLASKTELR